MAKKGFLTAIILGSVVGGIVVMLFSLKGKKQHNSDNDPIEELTDSIRDVFDKKNKSVSEKTVSALKCALLGLTIWQQVRRRK